MPVRASSSVADGMFPGNKKGRIHGLAREGHRHAAAMPLPVCCRPNAPRAHQFLLLFLLIAQRPLEQGQRRGLGLAVAPLLFLRFPGQSLPRLWPGNSAPGEQRLLPLGRFAVMAAARANAKTPTQGVVPEGRWPPPACVATCPVAPYRTLQTKVRPSEEPQRLGLLLVRSFLVR